MSRPHVSADTVNEARSRHQSSDERKKEGLSSHSVCFACGMSYRQLVKRWTQCTAQRSTVRCRARRSSSLVLRVRE